MAERVISMYRHHECRGDTVRGPGIKYNGLLSTFCSSTPCTTNSSYVPLVLLKICIFSPQNTCFLILTPLLLLCLVPGISPIAYGPPNCPGELHLFFQINLSAAATSSWMCSQLPVGRVTSASKPT